MSKNINDLLNELDNQNSEDKKDHEIWMEIHKVNSEFPSHEAEMEKMAFYISEVKGMHVQSEWDFFFPHTITNDSRGLIEYPTFDEITEDIVDYWKKRYEQTKNLFMKLRYMGLVLVFEKKFIKKKNYQLTCAYIELLIDVSTKNIGTNQELIRYAERAIDLSKSINNPQLIDKSILNLINLEDKISDISLASTWGFCFKILVLEKEKNLTELQKQKIVKDMEDKFVFLSEKEDRPPYMLISTIESLTEYYRSNNNVKKIEEILKKYSVKIKQYVGTVRPIIASTELMDLYNLLVKNHLHDEANSVLVLLNENGDNVIKDMSMFETTHEISHEVMEDMIRKNIEGEFDQTFLKLVLKNVISKKDVLNTLEQKYEKFPLLQIFSGQTVLDDNGRIKQRIDANNDDESLLLKEMGQTIILNSSLFNFFLREIIIKNNKSCEDLVDLIYKSPVFKVENREIIFKGVEAFLNENHIVSVHLLIPQIEVAFKKIIELQSGNILQKNKFNGMNFQTLDSLIKDNLVENIYDDETIFYFRAVLSDPRGLNIRNDVCHGIVNADSFNFSYSLLIMHIIFLLARIRDDISHST
jgi:hypothetical protein